MKFKSILPLILLCMAFMQPSSARAFDLKDLLGGNSALTNFVEGLFSRTDLSPADLAGQWTIDGSAVSFQSDNFLKKAGGLAAASAIEAKIDPYLKQYGLTGAVMTVDTLGSVKLKFKYGTVNGKFEKAPEGSDYNFIFHVTALGRNINSIPTYVQKTSDKMEVMFDAEKLKTLLGYIGKFTNSKLATTALQMLDSYQGLCVGFATTLTGKAPATSGNSSGSGVGSILNGIFNPSATPSGTTGTNTRPGNGNTNSTGKNSGNSSTTNDAGSKTNGTSVSGNGNGGGLDSLINILTGGSKSKDKNKNKNKNKNKSKKK